MKEFDVLMFVVGVMFMITSVNVLTKLNHKGISLLV